MRRALLCLVFATPLVAQQQAAAPARVAVASARLGWSSAHDYIVRAAEQMPESDYGFKPVPTVRSFGQIVAHVADDETAWCAQILGEPMKQTGYEKTLTSKADIVKAIKDAGAMCEKAYAIDDAKAAERTPIWNSPQPRIRGLVDNANHDWEHYGNLVTYMRIKGMVPPSSQQ